MRRGNAEPAVGRNSISPTSPASSNISITCLTPEKGNLGSNNIRTSPEGETSSKPGRHSATSPTLSPIPHARTECGDNCRNGSNPAERNSFQASTVQISSDSMIISCIIGTSGISPSTIPEKGIEASIRTISRALLNFIHQFRDTHHTSTHRL